jgi:hypothetical protein
MNIVTEKTVYVSLNGHEHETKSSAMSESLICSLVDNFNDYERDDYTDFGGELVVSWLMKYRTDVEKFYKNLDNVGEDN